MQVRKLFTNQNAETVVNTAESGAVGLIFAMFMGVITVAAHVALFPFTGILGLARSGLLIWRHAKSDKLQMDAKVRLALEIVASLAIGVAVLGGFLWASAFALAAPIMFTATLAVKTIHTLVMACIYSYKAFHERDPELKKQHKQTAIDCFIGFIGGAFVTAAAGLTMIGGWLSWSLLGMGGAAIGVGFGGRSLFKACRKALIEDNYVQPVPSPKETDSVVVDAKEDPQVRQSPRQSQKRSSSSDCINRLTALALPPAAREIQMTELKASATHPVPFDEEKIDKLKAVWADSKGISSATRKRLVSIGTGESLIESIASGSVTGYCPQVSSPTLAQSHASSASLTLTPAFSSASLTSSPMPASSPLVGESQIIQAPTPSPVQIAVQTMQFNRRGIAISHHRSHGSSPMPALPLEPGASPLPGIVDEVVHPKKEAQMTGGSVPRHLIPLHPVLEGRVAQIDEWTNGEGRISSLGVHGARHMRSESGINGDLPTELTGLTKRGTKLQVASSFHLPR